MTETQKASKLKIITHVDATEFVDSILGSAFETWSWWARVEYTEGFEWSKYPADENKTFLTVEIDDPNADEDAEPRVTVRRDISTRDLADAYSKYLEQGGHHAWDDLDASSSDCIMQTLMLGKVEYA